MKLLLLLICLFSTQFVFSQDEESLTSSVNIEIKELNYLRPPSGTGEAGVIKFTKFEMNRADMETNINNESSLFDANIQLRPDYIDFKGKYLNIGFFFNPNENSIKDILSGGLEAGKIQINDRVIKLTSDLLHYKNQTSNLRLKNARMTCIRNPEYLGMDSPSFISACFNKSRINGQKKKSFTDATIEYVDQQENGLSTKFNIVFDKLQMSENRIELVANSTELVLDDSFSIQTKDVVVDCYKRSNITEIDTVQLQKDCVSDLNLDIKPMLIQDSLTSSSYYIQPEQLSVKDERLSFTLPRIQLGSPENITTIYDLKGRCLRPRNRADFLVEDMLEDCLEGGYFSIKKLVSSDDKKDIKKVLKAHKEYSESGIDPTKMFNKDKPTMKNMDITFGNGKFQLKTKIKILKWFKVALWGNAAIDKEKKELEFKITKADLPLGFKSIKLTMRILKKYVISESENLYTKNGKIYLKLVTE